MSIIVAIAQLCAFNVYFASSGSKDKLVVSQFSHDYCIASYTYCVDAKRKGTWDWREQDLQEMLWRCMKEKR